MGFCSSNDIACFLGEAQVTSEEGYFGGRTEVFFILYGPRSRVAEQRKEIFCGSKNAEEIVLRVVLFIYLSIYLYR